MSLIQPVSDVNNTFLSRREITCNFAGLAGKLKKLEAIDMITKEFDLGSKVVIPMRLKSHSGKSSLGASGRSGRCDCENPSVMA